MSEEKAGYGINKQDVMYRVITDSKGQLLWFFTFFPSNIEEMKLKLEKEKEGEKEASQNRS